MVRVWVGAGTAKVCLDSFILGLTFLFFRLVAMLRATADLLLLSLPPSVSLVDEVALAAI